MTDRTLDQFMDALREVVRDPRYTRRVTATGMLRLKVEGEDQWSLPSLAMDSAGDMAAIWINNIDYSAQPMIVLQRFNPDGSLKGDQITVSPAAGRSSSLINSPMSRMLSV